ncbi:MAG TPA: VWA domain-containing protein [Pyrinomonadaceae bacterium]|nr:VWA domain-containing protein [Pyrinomonadaceae bacterium]
MPSKTFPFAALLLSLSLSAGPPARAQQPPASQDEEVVRVETELVQTDVTVFDKQGKFVDGLTADQFELKVDGKPQAVSFFERVVAGSVDEDAQLAAARGRGSRPAPASAAAAGAVKPLDRGRVVVFFVDDLHLSPPGVKSTRDTLLRFLNEQMGQNDQAVVFTASGQLGFLQQLTGDKAVLRRAIEQLVYRGREVRDFERPPMSMSQALAVERRDPMVVNFYVEHLLRETPMMRRDVAENMVLVRATQIISQSDAVAIGTLATLEHLVRMSAQIPGRKIAFFFSEGFHITSRDTQLRERLRRIADASARSGVVIYSLDAKGLTSGMPDASTDVAFDPGARLMATQMSERGSLLDPLYSLAVDTGGRALVNTNALSLSLTNALKETSVYYLLAWRPDGVAPQRAARSRRVEVSVRGRPDLSVNVRRGHFDAPLPPLEAKRQKGKEKEKEKEKTNPAADELRDALVSVFPTGDLPTALSVGYVNTPTHASVVNATVEIDDASLDYASATAPQNARADVLGAIFDREGKPVSTFKQQLSVLPPKPEAGAARRRITYSQQVALPPGLYQVRIAARDARSGRTGSAAEWLEIPDFSKGRFGMSSIFIGEKTAQEVADVKGADGAPVAPVLVSGDRRFSRDSRLRFLLHVYNAALASNAPDVALQVQVFRDDQPVITTPLSRVKADGLTDKTRIPYAAEMNLTSLPAGRYVLQVNAIDRVAKAHATQKTSFTVQ